MGWLWSSSSSDTTPNASSSASSSTPNSEPTPPTQSLPKPSPVKDATPLSADDLAAQEFRNAIAELEEDDKDRRTPFSRTSPAHPSQQESIFPSEMSCRQAFDEAYYCASFGGQFMNVYRYGELRHCSDHWNSFWFCMRVKGYGDTKRRAMIRQHYREKEAKVKSGPSSEDVWKIRSKPVEKAFHLDPDVPLEANPEKDKVIPSQK